MKKAYLGIGALVIVLLAGGLLLMNFMKNNAPAAEESPAPTSEESMMMDDEAMEDNMASMSGEMMEEEGDVVELDVEGGSFYFKPETIKVKKGQTVRINFTNAGGVHDFMIDEFDVATERTNTGETDSVEFVASEAGEFEYYCSVPGHKEKGMLGTLVVEE